MFREELDELARREDDVNLATIDRMAPNVSEHPEFAGNVPVPTKHVYVYANPGAIFTAGVENGVYDRNRSRNCLEFFGGRIDIYVYKGMNKALAGNGRDRHKENWFLDFFTGTLDGLHANLHWVV